ncbi:hypothetical protein ACKZDW_20960 [Ralstonia syzygii subsp. celebesensis]|uniref:Uncharacterized protein n=2 Tax=Ralstonia syzygii subsp. celebesensis TaxID=1310168 RepID=A0A1U9VFI7_9RALS|nr:MULTISPECIES: hypothetical protein [Ralstonia solanacearum species complex]AQW29464.1 hypothetical protein B0B51_05260 [blood disease bacterium A2-HR MARDI]QQV56664.1 hypothetical protein JK151_06905 [Ralstonia syzygii subsp. celebesensis]CBJ51003.1 exported protein of unknown function [Ralstonia solanacearum PSI07]CCA79826.1 conserved exported hypothetical protein [blood disease bacterium R229]
MGNTALTAVATGLFTLLVAVVTYLLTKKREHEADWRKAKLEHYREYIAALSGITEGRSTPTGHARYSDAVNSMALIAPPAVLAAVYAFQDEISCRNTARSDEAHDRLLANVLLAMRRDVHPNSAAEEQGLQIRRLITVPAAQDGR